jgi:hypothetical protein
VALIIGAHPRSGTTLLEHICAAHPDMAVTHEFGNFRFVGATASTYVRETLRWLLAWNRARSREQVFPGGRRASSRGPLQRAARTNLLVARYLLAIRKGGHARIGVAEIEGGLRTILGASPIFGDKLPDYVFRLDELARVEELTLVTIYRDCRDVTSSTLTRFRTVERDSTYWRESLSSAATIARRWVRSIEIMDSHAERVHAIRYEDLVRRPDRELEALAAGLGVDARAFPRAVVRDSSIGAHRGQLSRHEMREIVDIAGPTLARLGYD